MSEGSKPNIEEILAACRRLDQGRKAGAAQPAQTQQSPAPTSPDAQTSPSAAAGSSPGTAGQQPRSASSMSVEEVLAAARRKPAAVPQQPAGVPAPAESGGPKPTKTGAEMSVAEVLAAARRGAKPQAAAAESPQVTASGPTANKAPSAEKPAARHEVKPAAPKPAAPLLADTASILAAARAAAKPGPMSKAEAAARAKPTSVAGPPKAKSLVPPERPAYLERPSRPTPTSPSRRSFFGALVGVIFGSSLAVGFSSLFVTNLLWLLGLARFMFPNILTEPPTVFKVGFPDDYAPGQVETRFVAQFGVWIVRYEYQGQQQIFALRTVCTHLGCTPNWLEAEQKFKCPCHGSGFYKDGINFEGPAPRPLERYAIRIAEDGQLEVDKSRRFQEELGQWKDPASFVPV